MKTAIFLNNRNRFQSLISMCDCCSKYPESEIFIIDNGSTYPPLIKWYETCNYNLIKLNKNGSNRAPWNEKILDKYKSKFDYYVVSDCDLDLSEVPLDVLNILISGLEKHKTWKAGLSLRIDDIPKNVINPECAEYEKQYWKTSLDDNFYLAKIATTFALHSFRNSLVWNYSAIRSKPPYMARHIPWYFTKENLSKEEKYYLEYTEFITHWTKRTKVKLKI